jgi:hypothetical protein
MAGWIEITIAFRQRGNSFCGCFLLTRNGPWSLVSVTAVPSTGAAI